MWRGRGGGMTIYTTYLLQVNDTWSSTATLDLGKPTYTLIPWWILKPLPPRNQCTGWFVPTYNTLGLQIASKQSPCEIWRFKYYQADEICRQPCYAQPDIVAVSRLLPDIQNLHQIWYLVWRTILDLHIAIYFYCWNKFLPSKVVNVI
jgi:hypothetical protein